MTSEVKKGQVAVWERLQKPQLPVPLGSGRMSEQGPIQFWAPIIKGDSILGSSTPTDVRSIERCCHS